MNCPFCGYRYLEEEGKTSCEKCPMNMGCDMLRCPLCGYETPKTLKVQKFKRIFRRNKNANQ